MKYQKKHKILSAAASENHRYMVAGVKFEKDCLIATNGRVLVVVPVEDTDGDVSGILSADAMKLAGRGEKRGETTIASLNGSETGPIARVFGKDSITADFPHVEGNFPDWEAVIPKPSTTDLTVILSGKQLKNVIDALGVAGDNLDGVRFSFKRNSEGGIDNRAPVRVEASGNDAYGCIMPISR